MQEEAYYYDAVPLPDMDFHEVYSESASATGAHDAEDLGGELTEQYGVTDLSRIHPRIMIKGNYPGPL